MVSTGQGKGHAQQDTQAKTTSVHCTVSPDFSPGFGILGQASKAGWLIACKGIGVAMGKTDKGKGSENLFPVERVAQG